MSIERFFRGPIEKDSYLKYSGKIYRVIDVLHRKGVSPEYKVTLERATDDEAVMFIVTEE